MARTNHGCAIDSTDNSSVVLCRLRDYDNDELCTWRSWSAERDEAFKVWQRHARMAHPDISQDKLHLMPTRMWANG